MTERNVSPQAESVTPGSVPEITSLQALLPLLFSFAPNRIISAAIQLGVFTEIATGRADAAALADSEESSNAIARKHPIPHGRYPGFRAGPRWTGESSRTSANLRQGHLQDG